jgi:hypothetical protein
MHGHLARARAGKMGAMTAAAIARAAGVVINQVYI